MVVDPKFTKEVDSFLSLQTETNTLKTLTDKSLLFTLCDRDLTSNGRGNVFQSLNLPPYPSSLTTGSTISKLFPELQQLNVDKIIICAIPASGYSEFIDGRTITLDFPQNTPTLASQLSMSSVTIVSSTYTSDKILKSESSPLLGDNVCFLFCDNINVPYTGSTVDELGQDISQATHTTWEPNPNNFLERPSAVAYSEVKRHLAISGVPTDTRTNINFAATGVTSTYPDNRDGYKYDIPVGFFVLDKGVAVITHPQLIDTFPWSSGFTDYDDAAYPIGGDTDSKKNIYFTGETSGGDAISQIEFQDINTSFQTTVVCIGMPREFYISNNSTWDRESALASLNEQTGIISLSPIYISEVGLYNSIGELVAVSKLSEPVTKNYTDVITFVLDIEM